MHLGLLLTASVALAEGPSTWTLLWENDSWWALMWDNTYRDEFYTHGLRLSTSRWVDGPADTGLARTAYTVADALRLGEAESAHFGLSQTMYTPVAFWEPYAQPDDHPWGGHLHLTAGLGAMRGGWRTSIELLGGVTGPPSLVEPTQIKAHETFGADAPEGWDHQIAAEPTVGVSVGLSEVRAATWTDGTLQVRAVPTLLAVAATTDLAAEVGGLVGIGTVGDVPSVRPEEARFGHSALEGPGATSTRVGLSVYAFADARVTAHDQFVSGGTFTSVEAPVAERSLAELGVGVTARIHHTRIHMVNNYQTAVFAGQPYHHVYGAISLAQDFGTVTNR